MPSRGKNGISQVISTVVIVTVVLAVALASALWAGGLATYFTRFDKVEILNSYAIRDEQSNSYNIIIRFKNSGSSDTAIIDISLNGKPLSDFWSKALVNDTVFNEVPIRVGESKSITISLLDERSAPLSGWRYRKSHVILGSSAGDLTDYQINFTVHYGTGTDSGSHVYLNGHCNGDFSDVRFTTEDGVTQLSYWIERKVDKDYAIFWVKMPNIPKSPGSTKIYIYYGNANATSLSNGINTFLQFGDFSGTGLPSGWTYSTVGTTGSVSISGGTLTVSNDRGSDVWNNNYQATLAYKNSKISGNFIAVARVTYVQNTNGWAKAGIFLQNEVSPLNNNGEAYIVATISYGVTFAYQSNANYIAPNTRSYGGSYTLPLYLRLIKVGTSVSGYYSQDGLTWTQRGNVVTPRGISSEQYVALFFTPRTTSRSGSAKFDMFYVRKYASPEPSHSIWASEEQYNVADRTALSPGQLLQVNLYSSSGKIYPCAISVP